ncbi:MAG: hypothetical protein SR1Q7_02335 [Quinella sp. 1Q7]|nr:hypothetical protein [Quinella sp. 1Q7]
MSFNRINLHQSAAEIFLRRCKSADECLSDNRDSLRQQCGRNFSRRIKFADECLSDNRVSLRHGADENFFATYQIRRRMLERQSRQSPSQCGGNSRDVAH